MTQEFLLSQGTISSTIKENITIIEFPEVSSTLQYEQISEFIEHLPTKKIETFKTIKDFEKLKAKFEKAKLHHLSQKEEILLMEASGQLPLLEQIKRELSQKDKFYQFETKLFKLISNESKQYEKNLKKQEEEKVKHQELKKKLELQIKLQQEEQKKVEKELKKIQKQLNTNSKNQLNPLQKLLSPEYKIKQKEKKVEQLNSSISKLELNIELKKNKIQQLQDKKKLGKIHCPNPLGLLLTLGLSFWFKSNTCSYKILSTKYELKKIEEKIILKKGKIKHLQEQVTQLSKTSQKDEHNEKDNSQLKKELLKLEKEKIKTEEKLKHPKEELLLQEEKIKQITQEISKLKEEDPELLKKKIKTLEEKRDNKREEIENKIEQLKKQKIQRKEEGKLIV